VNQKSESPLRELCRGVWPAPDPESEARRRARIAGRVLEVQQQLSAQSERRRRSRWVVLLAAIVTGCCAVGVLSLRPDVLAGFGAASDELRLVAGHASLSSGGVLAALEPGEIDVSAEPVVVTRADERAEFRLSSNTALDLAPSSEVGILRRRASAGAFEERVRLRTGSVALRVPKLGTHGKVSVETRDALIEVHGTRFSVSLLESPEHTPFTRVDVAEGRVLVRSGDSSRFLTAGEHWQSGQASPTSAAPAAAAAPPPEPEPSRANEAPHARARTLPSRALPPGPPSPSASELGAQNRLLEAAELAQRSGMPALALERLETLIARYPDAELAHNAEVERFRLLASLGRKSEAVAAARQYIKQRPHGFAHAEAESLLETLGAPAP